MAGSVCESADLFHVHGESDSVSPWSVGAVCGDTDEDGLVICVVDCVPCESPCFCDAWTVVFDDHVSVGDEIKRYFSSCVGVEVEVDDSFACVGAVVDG